MFYGVKKETKWKMEEMKTMAKILVIAKQNLMALIFVIVLVLCLSMCVLSNKWTVQNVCAVSSIVISVWVWWTSSVAKKDSVRPVVVVEVVVKEHLYCLKVTNIGLRAARKINLSKITPHFRIDIPEIQETRIRFVEHGIRMLQSREDVICAFANEETIDAISREKTFRGEVTYEDEGGRAYTSLVDIDALNAFESVVPSDKSLKDVVKSLDSISDRIGTIGCKGSMKQ